MAAIQDRGFLANLGKHLRLYTGAFVGFTIFIGDPRTDGRAEPDSRLSVHLPDDRRLRADRLPVEDRRG
jgi:hypothetical protein